MDIVVTRADYDDPEHRRIIPALLDDYASGPAGGGEPLSHDVRSRLVDELARRPYAFSVLAWCDGTPAGLVNCFEGFSTFSCKPLVNIHDVIVVEAYRGQGLCGLMLTEVERIARQKACCKLTLEVLDGNTPALSAYTKFGFSPYELDPACGTARFLDKKLAGD